MAIQTIEKYLLSPILSRNHPSGKPNIPTTRYVTVIFLPAVTCEKQNRTCKSLFALSRNGTYSASASIHKNAISQYV